MIINSRWIASIIIHKQEINPNRQTKLNHIRQNSKLVENQIDERSKWWFSVLDIVGILNELFFT